MSDATEFMEEPKLPHQCYEYLNTQTRCPEKGDRLYSPDRPKRCGTVLEMKLLPGS